MSMRLATGLLLSSLLLGASRMAPPRADWSIHWLSFPEAFRLAEINKKLILVDIYTPWCAWCKVMDQKTYAHPDVIGQVNAGFYAVRLNAEGNDTVRFRGRSFARMPGKRTHQLAYELLNGNMSYPSTVILNAKGEILSPIPGYLEPPVMLKVLRFFHKGIYLHTPWETYEREN